MDSVNGVGAARRVCRAQIRASRLGGDFQLASVTNIGVPDVSPLAPAGLLALQDDAAPTRRDRVARQGGERVLTALDAIHRGLLDEAGQGLAVRLSALEQALAGMSVPADPDLAPILAQIRLRAQVEITRRRCVQAALLEKS